MDLDDVGLETSACNNYGANKQSGGGGAGGGERNLTTRRHTVGPSETAHDKVLGTHLKYGRHAGITQPSFYPMPGFPDQGFDPLVFSALMYSPLGFNPSTHPTQMGLLANFDFRTATGAASALNRNVQFTATGVEDPASLSHSSSMFQSISVIVDL